MSTRPSLDGLWPNCFERSSGVITFGADGDSFYEYLLKGYLQGGKQEPLLWKMYNDAVDGMEKWLVHKGPEGLTYLSNVRWTGGGSASQDHAMEHLSCFAAGWLALGSRHQTDPGRKRRHMKLAEDIAETCWQVSFPCPQVAVSDAFGVQ